MSAYPWLQRHKRYLSFRYIFPRAAALWIQWRRLLLRVVWLFSQSVDEFLDGLREALLWPVRALTDVGQWASAAGVWISAASLSVFRATYEFCRDFNERVETSLRWLGRVPVWTGAAIAGVMGIVLTILLFLLPVLQTTPVVASIAAVMPTADVLPDREATAKEVFDPFAEPAAFVDDEPALARQLPVRSFGEPRLVTDVARLSTPLDMRRRMRVASESSLAPRRDRWSRFDRFAGSDGWFAWRVDRIRRALEFSPYASHPDSNLERVSPNGMSPEADIPPVNPFSSRRQPAVVVEKSAPSSAPLGRPLRYSLLVTNRSEEMLESVTVRERVSAMERVSRVQPPANVVGDELVWQLTEFEPGGHRRLQVELVPNERMLLAHTTTVEVTTAVAAVSDARRPRPAAALEEPAGEQPPPQREPAPATRMILPEDDSEELAPSIPEAEPMAGRIPEAEPVPYEPEELFPSELELFPVPPQGDEPPPVDPPAVLPPGAEFDEFSDSSTRVIPEPEPPLDALKLEMLTPPAVSSGGNVRTIFELHNHGEAELVDIVLAVEFSGELQHEKGRNLELRIDRLAAGETYRTRLTTRAVEDGMATMASQVTSPGIEEQSVRREIRISPGAAPAADLALEVPRACPPRPCYGVPGF